MFKRKIYHTLLSRLSEARRFIQVLIGPRQVGKTTLAHQIIDALTIPCHFASADEPTLHDRTWIEQQWALGRLRAKREGEAILILDEIQKIDNWTSTIKQLWDEDTAANAKLKVMLLGSSSLLLQRGLTESLAGRFELIRVPHWSFNEMQTAFGYAPDQYIYFGGYPGATPLITESERWSRYIIDSLIETTLSRDILQMTRVDKPALLRRLFQLGCDYSGQVLSYQKMLGQLQDAGNTTTLAHYLDLLTSAGMLTGIQKFAGEKVRQRASSPKLQVLNTALMSAQSHLSFDEAQTDRELWGRLVESAVGAHLINTSWGTQIQVSYWREKNAEVDFVLKHRDRITAFEVKSGRAPDHLPGMAAFSRAFKPQQTFLIGGQGISIEEFLKTSAADWV